MNDVERSMAMIAEIQKFEDAARMAMGHFEAPRPRRRSPVLHGLERPVVWMVGVAVLAGTAAITLL